MLPKGEYVIILLPGKLHGKRGTVDGWKDGEYTIRLDKNKEVDVGAMWVERAVEGMVQSGKGAKR